MVAIPSMMKKALNERDQRERSTIQVPPPAETTANNRPPRRAHRTAPTTTIPRNANVVYSPTLSLTGKSQPNRNCRGEASDHRHRGRKEPGTTRSALYEEGFPAIANDPRDCIRRWVK